MINAHLQAIIAEQPYLIAQKLAGSEQSTLQDADLSFHQHEYERLQGELLQSSQQSSLPDGPAEEDKNALNDLLIRLRLISVL